MERDIDLGLGSDQAEGVKQGMRWSHCQDRSINECTRRIKGMNEPVVGLVYQHLAVCCGRLVVSGVEADFEYLRSVL